MQVRSPSKTCMQQLSKHLGASEMEEDPIKNDARREARKRILTQRRCLSCGISDLPVLALTKPSQLNENGLKLLQEHHLFHRANDRDFTITLCLNHHAELTAKNLDHGVSTKKPETVLHQAIAMVGALGVFFLDLSNRIARLADWLLQLLAALDEKFPAWRSMPEAKPHAD